MPTISTPLVTIDDLRVAYENDIPADAAVEARVQWLLDVAVAKLSRARQYLRVDIANGSVDPILVTAALVNAVLRVLRNPGAYRSETAGEFSYTLNTTTASGLLSFTGDELADCSPVSSRPVAGIGSIRLGVPSAVYPRVGWSDGPSFS